MVFGLQCNVDLLPGIELALDTMPENGVILMVTDSGTKQRDLEASIKKKSKEKNIKIFISFSPECRHQRSCIHSMPSYDSVSEGRVFNKTDLNSEKFFKSVVYTVRNLKKKTVLLDVEIFNIFEYLLKIFCCSGKESVFRKRSNISD